MPKAKTSARAADAIVDGLGRPVREWLKPTFAGRQQINRWIDEASILILRLKVWSGGPFSRDMPVNEIEEHINAAIHLIQDAKPFQVCGCESSEHDCQLCEGERWLSVGRARKALPQAPGEQRPG